MRFCLVSTQDNWGGGEVLLGSVARQFERTGHTVAWITRADCEVAQQVARGGGTILHQTRRRGLNPRDWLAVRYAIRTWAPDVLILNDSHAVPLAGSAAWFSRTVKPLRLAYKHTVFPLRSKLKYQILSDKLICVSEAAKATVVRGGMPDDSVTVVYGGTDIPVAEPNARKTVRAELGLEDHQPLLVAIGSLLGCKGHRDLVAAAQRICSDTNACIAIAGEGEERGRLEKQIAETGVGRHVKLLGYRNDANRLLQAADLVVHPSHAEGLSLVLIQAQMLAKPIVATAVGGAAEVLGCGEPNACSSWIAKPSDPHDLAIQIAAALATLGDEASREPLSRRLDATSRRAKHLFSIEQNSLQLADFAASLLAQTD